MKRAYTVLGIFIVLLCTFLVVYRSNYQRTDYNTQEVGDSEPIFGVTIRSEWNNLCTRCLVRDAGVYWVRGSISWATYEPTRGNKLLVNLDKYIRGFVDFGMKPIIFISDNPTWAATSKCGPANPTAVASFLGALAERYDGDGDYNGDGVTDGVPLPNIEYWQLYNEPDNQWTTGEASTFDGCWGQYPEKYAEMLRLVYVAIHNANPDTHLVFGVAGEDVTCPSSWSCAGQKIFNFNINGGDFVDQVLSRGALFDVFDFHYYPMFHQQWDTFGVDIIGKATYYRNRLSARGYNVPLMATEVGRRSDAGQVIDGIPGSLDIQSSYVVKAYVRAMSVGMKVVLWFNLSDIYIGTEGSWAAWGLMTSSGQTKQSYTTYKVMTKQLEYATFVRSSQEVYEFKMPSGKPLLVAWGTGTLSVGSSARVIDKLGNERIVTGTVQLSDSPIYVYMQQAPLYVQRVNAGGGSYTDSSGNVWSADQSFVTGSWGYSGGLTYAIGDPIAGTVDMPLYQNVRYWPTGGGYKFTVPNGQYRVTLKFAEVYWWYPARKFDVRIEGTTVLSNFDMFGETGGRYIALDKTFTVLVNDGVLTMDFMVRPGYDYPVVNAMMIQQN